MSFCVPTYEVSALGWRSPIWVDNNDHYCWWLSFIIISVNDVETDKMGDIGWDHWQDWALNYHRRDTTNSSMRAIVLMISLMRTKYGDERAPMCSSISHRGKLFRPQTHVLIPVCPLVFESVSASQRHSFLLFCNPTLYVMAPKQQFK